jgi:hypothetical protein
VAGCAVQAKLLVIEAVKRKRRCDPTFSLRECQRVRLWLSKALLSFVTNYLKRPINNKRNGKRDEDQEKVHHRAFVQRCAPLIFRDCFLDGDCLVRMCGIRRRPRLIVWVNSFMPSPFPVSASSCPTVASHDAPTANVPGGYPRWKNLTCAVRRQCIESALTAAEHVDRL